MDLIMQLLEPIVGENPALKDFLVLILPIVLAWVEIKFLKSKKTIAASAGREAQKDSDILDLKKENEDIKKALFDLSTMMFVAFTSSKGIDANVKAAISDIYGDLKAVVGLKAKELFKEAIVAATDRLNSVVTAEQKKEILDKAAAIAENLGVTQEAVDKLLG